MDDSDNSAGCETASRQRLDDDDHDLMTFAEAGERLRIEIAATAAAVEALQVDGGAALERARTRLSALQAAARRNTSQPITDANFERFFGYSGRAKRNVPETT